MKLLSIVHLLVASGSRPRIDNTWFIDGYNLLGHKGTPRDPTVLAEKLQPIRTDSVILVLDGPKEGGLAETTVTVKDNFQNILLGQGMSADDYIMDEIKALRASDHRQRVHVVTADRRLRSAVLDIKPVVKGVVNPATFWKRYLPRLCGMKLPKLLVEEEQSTTTNAEGGEEL